MRASARKEKVIWASGKQLTVCCSRWPVGQSFGLVNSPAFSGVGGCNSEHIAPWRGRILGKDVRQSDEDPQSFGRNAALHALRYRRSLNLKIYFCCRRWVNQCRPAGTSASEAPVVSSLGSYLRARLPSPGNPRL